MADSAGTCDVAIIGAGLAGLALANLLNDAQLNVIVLEAQDRIGGRIDSVTAPDGSYAADLGPTWVWPEYQPIAKEWLRLLNVETFHQFERGEAVIDLDKSGPARRQFLPGQHGIRRPVGGPQALINILHKRLPKGTVRTGHRVTELEMAENGILVSFGGEEIPGFIAKRVVVAAPMRVAVETIRFPETLHQNVLSIMRATPTWMASQAKAVAVYDRPFWRDKGLSGRVASHAGPLIEIHDNGPHDGSVGALFGFIGWPPQARKAHVSELEAQIRKQLIRCFGEEGGAYASLHIQDWATNDAICSDADLAQAPRHPALAPDIMRTPHCGGRLFFSVSETAADSPGLIEGAFSAAGETAAVLLERLRAEAPGSLPTRKESV